MQIAPEHAPQGRLLAIDDDKGSLGDLALQMVRLGIDVLLASEVDEAELLARQEGQKLCAALIPSEGCELRVDPVLEAIGPHTGLGPAALVVVGRRLTDDEVIWLRERGLHWRLWSPYEDRDVRFLGRLLACSVDEDLRIDLRVPTALPATAICRGQSHDVLIGDLSPSGAYLESKETIPAGSLVNVKIALPGGDLSLRGMVRWATSAPKSDSAKSKKAAGVGVEFLRMHRDNHEALKDYLEGELERFRI